MFFKKKKEEKSEEIKDESEEIIDSNPKEINESPEKELKKKQRKRTWTRAILIILNALLGCYLLYFISDSVVEIYNTYFNSDNQEVFSINGMSKQDSLVKYNDAIDRDEAGNYLVTNAYDYGIYGGYLHFSSTPNMLENEGFSSFETYTLRDLAGDISFSSNLVYENTKDAMNYGIPLFSLPKGDYIVYPYFWEGKGEKRPLKIESQEGIYETLYTSIQNGTRKVIEMKSKSSSPALLISVRVAYALENNRHDVAILYDQEEDKALFNNIFPTGTQLEYIKKEASVNDNLIHLYNSHALVNIILNEGNDIKISHFLHVDNENITYDTTLSEGYLSGCDEDIYIRELGGYLFKAGEGYTNVNQILYPYLKDHEVGNITLHLGKNRINDLDNLLKSLLFFTN